MKDFNCFGLAPVVDERATHLVLGSMPGAESLRQKQYYAYPRNRFWPLMAHLLLQQETSPASYTEKIAMLQAHGVALWDVIAHCRREGSLDSSIRAEEPTDIPALLAKYPHLHVLCVNGGKAASALKKFHRPLLTDAHLTIYFLPSTSPANARWHLSKLIEVWSQANFAHK